MDCFSKLLVMYSKITKTIKNLNIFLIVFNIFVYYTEFAFDYLLEDNQNTNLNLSNKSIKTLIERYN